MRPVFRFSFAVLLLAGVSCQGGRKFYPARGSVLVNGKPAEGVTVVLSPQDGSELDALQPTAGTKADGSFELSTYITKERSVRAGAPAGNYVVTCYWYPPDAGNAGPGENVPDRLRGKYADPKKSTLQVEVPEHAVEFPPFQLETAPKK